MIKLRDFLKNHPSTDKERSTRLPVDGDPYFFDAEIYKVLYDRENDVAYIVYPNSMKREEVT